MRYRKLCPAFCYRLAMQLVSASFQMHCVYLYNGQTSCVIKRNFLMPPEICICLLQVDLCHHCWPLNGRNKQKVYLNLNVLIMGTVRIDSGCCMLMVLQTQNGNLCFHISSVYVMTFDKSYSLQEMLRYPKSRDFLVKFNLVMLLMSLDDSKPYNLVRV